MELSILTARILCIVYLAAGFGCLLRNVDYRKIYKDFQKNGGLVYMSGFTAIILGFLLVHYHNIWRADWIVLVTIIGWIALVKGCMLVAFPNSLQFFEPMFSGKFAQILPYCMIVFGLLFGYFGFLHGDAGGTTLPNPF